MKQAKQMDIQDYLEILLRRKWLIILPVIIFIIGGIVYALKSPKLYQASTLILIQRQKVPESYVKPTVTNPIGERLHTISQQIMSRTRLEMIIDEFNLYPKMRQTLFLEEVVEIMRKDVNLQVRGKDSFQLFYQGKVPLLVAKVANKLASLFIEENLKVREELAEGTTEFLNRELNRVKKRLVEQEEALRSYKEKHMGALPEQLNANLHSLDRLQLQYQSLITSLERAKERKILLQGQISQISAMDSQAIVVEEDEGVADDGAISTFEPPRLHELRQMLVNLQARYTEKHPDVVRIKNEIKKIEEALDGEEGGEDFSDTFYSDSSEGFGFEEILTAQLNETGPEIKKLEKELREVGVKVADYQRKVEEIPRREQEILGLKRDYSNTQKNYQSLLDKKLNAQLAANMERMQKGERFKVLDPARIPQKPFKPNRTMIVFLSMALGMVAGGVLVFGVEYMDHSFRGIDDLEKFTGLPVLASIANIVIDEDLKAKKIKKRIVITSSLVALVLMIAAAIVYGLMSRFNF